MDKADVIFMSDHETPHAVSETEPSPAEPYFDVFVAMQKRAAHRKLDDALAGLVADRAFAFAALTPREQAAIAWVEAVISSGKTKSSDGAYRALAKHFDEAAIAKLTALAGTASARAKLGTRPR